MMAERFGGPFSPGATGPAAPRPARMVFRTNLLFVLPAAFALSAFTQDAIGLVLNLAAFAVLLAGAVLTRDGLRAEEAYDARPLARRPALPRKLMGSAATGAGVLLGSAGDGGGVLAPIALGLLAAVLHAVAFGPDPLRSKGVAEDGPQADRVARLVDEAEVILTEIQAAIRPLRDPDLARRADIFAARAHEMCRAVEADPRDLTGVRRYLGVYLAGARDATRKFAGLQGRTPETDLDAGARRDYAALLDDLAASYADRTRRMLDGDRIDLDVEIGVLRDRLARDGGAAVVHPTGDTPHD